MSRVHKCNNYAVHCLIHRRAIFAKQSSKSQSGVSVPHSIGAYNVYGEFRLVNTNVKSFIILSTQHERKLLYWNQHQLCNLFIASFSLSNFLCEQSGSVCVMKENILVQIKETNKINFFSHILVLLVWQQGTKFSKVNVNGIISYDRLLSTLYFSL